VNHCLRHYEEPIAGVCRTCKNPFCTRCLVFSFGPKKPPYCLACALVASGIRNTQRPVAAEPGGESLLDQEPAALAAAGAKPDRRLERAMKRAEREAIKAAEKAAKKAARKGTPGLDPMPGLVPPPPPAPAEAARTSRVPAPSELLTAAGHAASGVHPL